MERKYAGDLQGESDETVKGDVKYTEMLKCVGFFFFLFVFRMKQKDAFISCKVVDGIESLPYAIKKDVRQHLLKLNKVQISSLDNTYP